MNNLQNIANNLFPTWPTIVATLLALGILLLVLTKLVYKPVKNMYEKRRQYVQDNIDESQKQLSDAHLDREKASEELLMARNQAQTIIDEANKVAEQVKMQSIVEAKDEAKNLVAQAQIDINKAREELRNNSRQTIVEVALQAASKIIEKEIDSQTHLQLIQEFIDKDKG